MKKEDDAFLQGFNFTEEESPFVTNPAPKQEKKQAPAGTAPAVTTKKSEDPFLQGFNFAEEESPFVTNPAPKQEKKQAPTQKISRVTRPTEEDPFLQGFNEPEKEEQEAKQALWRTTNPPPQKQNLPLFDPKSRAAAITALKKDIAENGRQAIFEREVSRGLARGEELPHKSAFEYIDNNEEIKTREEKNKELVKELSFAEDLEQYAKEMAQAAHDEEAERARLRGDDNPALAAMIAGEKAYQQYKKLAAEARNGVYEYNRAEAREELESVASSPDFAETVARAKQDESLPGNLLTRKIVDIARDNANAGKYSIASQGNDTQASKLQLLTDDERNTILYHAGRGEYDKIDDYYDTIERDLNARNSKISNEVSQEFAYEHPFIGGAVSVASGLAAPIAYFANTGHMIKNSVTGKYEPTDINSDWFGGVRVANSTQEGVGSRAYDAAGGGALGELASFGTDLIISGTRNAATNALGPWSLPVNALGKAGEVTYDSLERGATPEEAFKIANLTGTASLFSQKFPVDEVVKNIALSAFLEDRAPYQEEINLLKERGINGAESDIIAFVKTYGKDITKELINNYLSDLPK